MSDLNLSKLVEETMEAKKLLAQAKSNEKRYTQMLKKELDKKGITKEAFEEVGLKVSYIEQVKSTIDEDKLVEIVKNLIKNTQNEEVSVKISNVLETKTTVNEEKLEELIFENYINLDDISAAYTEKKYKTLRINTLK